jgi:1-aminocyclopropane-1-carboxylate deaminase/D-cysteine desulfhydrase-like pyridoxal-dependent ACC family enzyme
MNIQEKKYTNWSTNHEYHFGGFAKKPGTLLTFINSFHSQHQILLDPVYTGKMMAGIIDLITKDYFKRGSTIIALHTGGIQNAYSITET